MGRTKIHKPSIFQGQLQFSASRGSFALNAEHPLEAIAFRAFFILLLGLIFVYIYLVGFSALNIIARKEALAQAAQAGALIVNSERAYFAASQKVVPEAGLPLGLAPVAKTAYVYRPGTVGQASVSHNEI
ncbi:MAG: hypothetical protein Q8Q13_02500 [bacterium]|nr:hypothetical protein [bacterium]